MLPTDTDLTERRKKTLCRLARRTKKSFPGVEVAQLRLLSGDLFRQQGREYSSSEVAGQGRARPAGEGTRLIHITSTLLQARKGRHLLNVHLALLACSSLRFVHTCLCAQNRNQSQQSLRMVRFD